jgi:F420-0:gamma-glutamyl ligase
MIITPIKTPKVLPNSVTLLDLITVSISEIKENSILAITSKVVSLCENRVKSMSLYDKKGLVKQESDRYTNPIG